MNLNLLLVTLFLGLCFAHLNDQDGGPLKHKFANSKIPTAHWAVKLLPGADPAKVAAAHGFVNRGKMDHVGLKHPNTYLFERPAHVKEGDHPHLSSNDKVLWFENQERKYRAKREFQTPTDPLYFAQWNLHDTEDVDINVLPVWEAGYTGLGVTVAIVDDGVFFSHPDLSENYNPEGSYDFNFNDDDPSPYYYDYHGTAAAGVAAAGQNDYCGVGVAPKANITAIRLLAAMATDSQEAQALSFRSDLNDIYSNSWGPYDDGTRLEGPGMLAAASMEQAVKQGRNGLGSIYIWSSGNGRRAKDSCNYDGYANSRYTIAIGSETKNAATPFYSEGCSALMAVAPSSGDNSVPKVVATGRIESKEPTCTSSFGGTSAAGPTAAGLVALILEMRPDLTWRDVQGVLVHSCQVINPDDSGWVTNGAGLKHHVDFGFGRIDAKAAMDVALPWTLYDEETELSLTNSTQTSIPSNMVFSCENDLILEHVEVHVEATLSKRGSFKITLTSPSGTISPLQAYHNDVGSNINWSYTSIRHWDETSRGDWILTVTPKTSSSNPSYLTSVTITFHGRSS